MTEKMRRGEGRFRTYVDTQVDSRIVRAANTAAAMASMDGGIEAIEIFDTPINCNGASEVPILARNWDTEWREFLFSPSNLATGHILNGKWKVNAPWYASSSEKCPRVQPQSVA